MTRRALSLGCAMLATGCARDEPAREPPVAQVVVTPVAPAHGRQQDTIFVGTTRAIHQPRPGATTGMMSAVRTMAQTGFDRVVFEFTGDSTPGYRVEYATRPVRMCGSGDSVTVAGGATLLVRFQPARAHDELGVAAPFERQRAPGLPVIKEMKVVCDFEGQVEWVLGLSAAVPFRVAEGTGPARLVLDVGHRP